MTPSPDRVVVVGQVRTLLGRRAELLELLQDTQPRAERGF
jgi:hypothetical protein